MSEFAIANPSSPDLASIAKIVKIVPLPSGQERGLDGTGTYIGPHQVLTAAHIVYYLIGNEPALRAYVGQVDVGAAMGAAATTPFDVAGDACGRGPRPANIFRLHQGLRADRRRQLQSI
ncbi:MAG: hypothetical protein U1E49_20475 [Hyphomicrobiaceae bacterium]